MADLSQIFVLEITSTSLDYLCEMTQVLRFRSTWGISPGPNFEDWKAWFPTFKELGYFGVEVEIAGLQDLHLLRQLCDLVGFEISVLIHTAWPRYLGPRPDGLKPDDHLRIYKEQLQLAKSLRAYKVNAQSGCDAWSLEECVAFYRGTLDIDIEMGLAGKVCHETHRNRCMFNPYKAREILYHVPE
ncbi:unnamed protein product [Parascedosporium putredinis]|uniref:Xylose isomerase-like TIM barrel domain-containing protein n=1 Tax=Parascedosporium putredinis TaxID=1442378 RepID=A0A9P1MCP5_9PEZI|nr:unnamed protein product [Parascedosporium putredinis]CAI7996996.1 unnamed protein product [Parascedosporium putredinis]